MYYSNDIAKKIKILVKNKNISLKEMFSSIGLGQNTMANLKTSMPKADNLAKIADYLNCSVDYLLGRTNNTEVNTVSNTIKNSKSLDISEIEPLKCRIIPLYETRVSAGTGSWLSDDIPVEWMTIPQNEQTQKADYMLRVVGDSMQPKYFEGDFLLVKESPSILEGEIGIFIVNSESFVKKMGRGELISLNPAYEPIQLTEYDDVRCAGKVIGTIEIQ